MSRKRSTLYPNGVSNAAAESFEGIANLRFPDPSKFHTYFNDFDTYLASDWTVTETGVATQALTDKNGGAILITNAAADNDVSASQLVGESFAYAADKELWFKTRLQISDATQSDLICGLWIKTATAPITTPPTDGIYFRKDDAAATIDFILNKDSTESVSAAIATLADATDVELAFHYDGEGTFRAYVDDVLVATQTTLTNVPDDEILTLGFAIQNGEAVAKTMTLDYILASLER